MDVSFLDMGTIWTDIKNGFDIWGPRLFRIVLIVIVLSLVWKLLVSTSRRLLQVSKARDFGSSKRFQTLFGIIRNLLTIGLFGLGVTLVLSELGVNLGPILAAAGVLGLAIGFGAQSLVKDVLNGFFIILEGQIRVGDWVRTSDGNRGRVEEITFRTLILRDLEGNVHIIPHGEIDTVINMTKAYSQCQVDIGVAYRENADEVFRLLMEEATALRDDPDVGEWILEDADILGITELADSAVVYRVRMKTETGRQWAVQRKYLYYVKRRFDREGVEIPYPHLTVYLGQDKEGSAAPLRVKRIDSDS
ncbi:mechanosensitive ion channel [bacterium]|nr:mechanosensitive ion channel [bacterium]